MKNYGNKFSDWFIRFNIFGADTKSYTNDMCLSHESQIKLSRKSVGLCRFLQIGSGFEMFQCFCSTSVILKHQEVRKQIFSSLTVCHDTLVCLKIFKMVVNVSNIQSYAYWAPVSIISRYHSSLTEHMLVC
jgi:hypothetical protein